MNVGLAEIKKMTPEENLVFVEQMNFIAKEMEKFLQTLDADITVAIMGCAVNGPGEAREADIGVAGGINEALLFKKGKVIRKIPQQDIVKELIEEIDKY